MFYDFYTTIKYDRRRSHFVLTSSLYFVQYIMTLNESWVISIIKPYKKLLNYIHTYSALTLKHTNIHTQYTRTVSAIRNQCDESEKIVQKAVQDNGFYTHPQHIILAHHDIRVNCQINLVSHCLRNIQLITFCIHAIYNIYTQFCFRYTVYPEKGRH